MAEKFKILWFSEMFALQMRVVSIWSLELQRVILCQFLWQFRIPFTFWGRRHWPNPLKSYIPVHLVLFWYNVLHFITKFPSFPLLQGKTPQNQWLEEDLTQEVSYRTDCELFVFGGNPRNIYWIYILKYIVGGNPRNISMIAAALEGFVLSGCLLPHISQPH